MASFTQFTLVQLSFLDQKQNKTKKNTGINHLLFPFSSCDGAGTLESKKPNIQPDLYSVCVCVCVLNRFILGQIYHKIK